MLSRAAARCRHAKNGGRLSLISWLGLVAALALFDVGTQPVSALSVLPTPRQVELHAAAKNSSSPSSLSLGELAIQPANGVGAPSRPDASLRQNRLRTFLDRVSARESQSLWDLVGCMIVGLLALNAATSHSSGKLPTLFAPDIEFILLLAAYLWYRAGAPLAFSLYPFRLWYGDALSFFFVEAFVRTRRPSYLVFAVNPLRSAVLVVLQLLLPGVAAVSVQGELHRSCLSSCIQLLCACALKLWVSPRGPEPICKGTEWAKDIPYASEEFREKVTYPILSLAFVASCVMSVAALTATIQNFAMAGLATEIEKLLLAVTLATSEEITWREVFLADGGNTAQAFIYGMTHLMVGQGVAELTSHHLLYGIIAFLYAFLAGIVRQYKKTRYTTHSSVEYYWRSTWTPVA